MPLYLFIKVQRGAWVAESVQPPTLDLSSGLDLRWKFRLCDGCAAYLKKFNETTEIKGALVYAKNETVCIFRSGTNMLLLSPTHFLIGLIYLEFDTDYCQRGFVQSLNKILFYITIF